MAEDHDIARRLSEGLAEIPGFVVDLDTVQTNIVIWGLTDKTPSVEEVVHQMAQHGVKVLPVGGHMLRAVTHRGLGAEDIEKTLAIMHEVVGL